MAKPALKLPQNVEGDLYVDSTCIDCDTCRQLAPEVFARTDAAEAAFVHHPPRAGTERERALMALVACPTASIGSLTKADAAAAARRFPLEMAQDVFFCGFTAESSFGAWSWLLRRPDGTGLSASRSVCWYSWAEQTRSMERLLAYPFERVFPGHGPVYRARTPDEAHAALAALLLRMRTRP
jgi:ferredoxin